MTDETYKTTYIISYVGEYNLKHSKVTLDLNQLEDFDKELFNQAMINIKKRFNIDDDYISCVIEINAKQSKALQIVNDNKDYLFYLLNKPYGIGADDGHYDYFPDLVEQFKQLCLAFDTKEIYNETIKQLKEHEEYKECEEVEFEVI